MMDEDCRFPINKEEDDVTESRIVESILAEAITAFEHLHEYEQTLQDVNRDPDFYTKFDLDRHLRCLNYLDIPMHSLGRIASLVLVLTLKSAYLLLILLAQVNR